MGLVSLLNNKTNLIHFQENMLFEYRENSK